jgi:hypothetical protein
MNPRIAFSTGRFGRAILGLALLGFGALGSASVQAAFITGSMGLGGAFTASGGTDLSDASILDLTSAYGTSGDGDIGGTVGFFTPGTVNNSPFSIASFSAVVNLLTIGGWQVDLGTMTIVDQTASVLNLAGTGTISGNGFDATSTQWTLSANDTGNSYSVTINTTNTTVPLPATAWVFITGLGLIGFKHLCKRS